MFCTHCGATVSDGARFCSRCGEQTSPGRALAQTYETIPTQPATARLVGSQQSPPPSGAPQPAPPGPTGGPYQGPQVHVTQQVQVAQPVVIAAPKSVGVALLLTFLFGPLGLFYSSLVGGIVMLIASVGFASVTWGVSLLVTWPICMIWGAIAASNYNSMLTARSQSLTQINR